MSAETGVGDTTHDGRALGTSVRIVVTDPALLEDARLAVDRVLREIDDTCSRFREDSELMRLTARAGTEVQVSPLLGRAMRAALRAARQTDGAVDPTVGGAMRGIGYDVDFDRVSPRGAALALEVHAIPGWQRVRYSEVSSTVFVPAGVELDFGSTAKALAADLAAEAALEGMGGGGVLVSLGGDIAVAGTPPGGGWRIQVADDSAAPVHSGEETIVIHAGGVATSSITVRQWRRGERVLHHIIDPRTGLPAEGPWRTVSVAAATCLDANVAATAAMVRGAPAVEWLEGLGLPARLVTHAGVVTRVGGWPEPEPGNPG